MSRLTSQLLNPRILTLAAVAALIGIDRLVAALTGGEGWIALPAGGAALVFALGHCDTLDGPLVKLARDALASGNVNAVLAWVSEEDEAEVREAFRHAVSVRALGGEAQALADRHFLETLVRVHRAGEGAGFTGLKPAGTLDEAIVAGDRALEDGSIDKVERLLTDAVRKGLHERFHEAMERRRFAPDDVEAGRGYVRAYVPYIHYVEKLWQLAAGKGRGHAEHDEPGHAAHHH
jgi:hypothetical protein